MVAFAKFFNYYLYNYYIYIVWFEHRPRPRANEKNPV